MAEATAGAPKEPFAGIAQMGAHGLPGALGITGLDGSQGRNVLSLYNEQPLLRMGER